MNDLSIRIIIAVILTALITAISRMLAKKIVGWFDQLMNKHD